MTRRLSSGTVHGRAGVELRLLTARPRECSSPWALYPPHLNGETHPSSAPRALPVAVPLAVPLVVPIR